MKKEFSLTDSEFIIMNLLWEKSPLTITEIEKRLSDSTNWSKHTIISFLKRMECKKVISFDNSNKAKLFYPIVSKNNICIEENKSFLSKLYGGKISLLISQMVDSKEINKEEIKDLLDILERGKDNDKNN